MGYADPEKQRAYQNAWLQRKRLGAGGAAVRETARRVRAREFGAEGDGVGPEWEAEQMERQGGRCFWGCGRDITTPIREPHRMRVGFDADHVIALENGGRHEAANLVLSCPLCNATRGGAITPRGDT